MTSATDRLEALLKRVLATEPNELNCDEFLERAAELLEALEADTEPPLRLRMVAQHLVVCPECQEEFDALLRLHAGKNG